MAATPPQIRVGIIGTGVHGSRYARHLLGHEVDGLELSVISRRSGAGSAQAGEWGVGYHPDWRDLVADRRVDAVIATVTPDLNLEIARHCAAAGKPLLVEKPIAVDTGLARSMIAVMDDAGTPLTVAQTLRYNPVILGLRSAISSANVLYAFSATQRLEPSSHPWLANPEVAGGGVILHTAVHLFDALRFITGREIVRVRAIMEKRLNPALEDLFAALVELEGGLIGTVDASKVGGARSGRYEFLGSAGQIQGDQVHGLLEFIRGANREEMPVGPMVPTIPALLTDWLALISGRGPNPIPGEEGLRAVAACEACRKSAAGDEWVTVEASL